MHHEIAEDMQALTHAAAATLVDGDGAGVPPGMSTTSCSPDRTGNLSIPRSAPKAWSTLTHRAGVPPLRLHSARPTTAIMFLPEVSTDES